MFNRLPIYSRPKEPAIGDISRPVLQSSTNEELANDLGPLRTQTIGLDGRPRNPSPALGPSSGNIGAHDQYNYSSTSSLVKALENEPQRPTKRAPPRRPARPDEPRSIPPQSASPPAQLPVYATPVTHRHRDERPRAPSPNTTFPHTLRSASPQASKKFNVTRKPAPPRDQIYDGSRGGFTGTTITAITGGSNNHPKPGGFANLKEKVVGRGRRPSRTSPTTDSDSDYERGDGFYSNNKMVEIPSDDEGPISVKPANMMLIDEWLSDREKLHKRSTMNTVGTRHSRAEHGRTGVPPGEFLPIPEPTMPLIPAHFLPRTSSAPPSSSPPFSRPPPSMARVEAPPPSVPSADRQLPVRRDAPHHGSGRDVTSSQRQPRSQDYRQDSRSRHPPRKDSVPAQLPPPKPLQPQASPPRPTEPTQPEQPKDRVQRLEEEQESLERRKRDLKKEIHNLEQLLPPNITSHPRGTKEEMMEQMEILNRAVADVEKDLYEIGMKLHRAYRRYEKTTGSEGPTHLWISRVMARQEGVE